MLDSVNLLRGVRPAAPPRDEYNEVFVELYGDAYYPSAKDTWKDKIARRIISRITLLLLRDGRMRRRLCLALAAELRDVDLWMDQPLVGGAPPPPDKDHPF